MPRLRLFDLKLSDFPTVYGLCQADTQGIARLANSVQRRLLYAKEAGEESWWGTWTEMAFFVSRTQPYLTLPREVARLELVDVCNVPRRVNNQFFEFLQYGNGRMPRLKPWCDWRVPQIYSRNVVPTFVDLSNPPQMIRVYLTDPADSGKRVLIQGTDNNGNTVYSQAGLNQVTGEYVNLSLPFSSAVSRFNTITGIQKDITQGPVQIFQTDPNTGAQVLLLTMEPSEMVSGYRRYFFDPLPRNCCPTPTTPDQITINAIVKLEPIPVQVDQDYLVLQNLEAFIEEAQSKRLSMVDNKNSKAMAIAAHVNAIRLLSGELAHYLGINEPAVVFAPFGSARLRRQRIGSLM